jgi:hypothetical protein
MTLPFAVLTFTRESLSEPAVFANRCEWRLAPSGGLETGVCPGEDRNAVLRPECGLAFCEM